MDNAGLIPLPQDDLELQSEVEIPSDIGDDINLEAEDDMTKSTNKPELTAAEQQELNKALLSAAREGNADEITHLIDRGAEVNAADRLFGNTPLIMAARDGHTEIAQMLIQKAANIDAANNLGYTALMMAIEPGDIETAQMLIERGANVDAANNLGDTPLIMAIEHGRTKTAQMLIERGANVDLADRDGNTPLMMAIERGDTEIAQMLIERGANVDLADRDGNTPLMMAIERGRTKTAQMLIERGADVNTANLLITPLGAAVIFGRAEIAQMLIQNGADVNAANDSGTTALISAVGSYSNPDTVRVLLENGAELHHRDTMGRSAIDRIDNEGPNAITFRNLLNAHQDRLGQIAEYIEQGDKANLVLETKMELMEDAIKFNSNDIAEILTQRSIEKAPLKEGETMQSRNNASKDLLNKAREAYKVTLKNMPADLFRENEFKTPLSFTHKTTKRKITLSPQIHAEIAALLPLQDQQNLNNATAQRQQYPAAIERAAMPAYKDAPPPPSVARAGGGLGAGEVMGATREEDTRIESYVDAQGTKGPASPPPPPISNALKKAAEEIAKGVEIEEGHTTAAANNSKATMRNARLKKFER